MYRVRISWFVKLLRLSPIGNITESQFDREKEDSQKQCMAGRYFVSFLLHFINTDTVCITSYLCNWNFKPKTTFNWEIAFLALKEKNVFQTLENILGIDCQETSF